MLALVEFKALRKAERPPEVNSEGFLIAAQLLPPSLRPQDALAVAGRRLELAATPNPGRTTTRTVAG